MTEENEQKEEAERKAAEEAKAEAAKAAAENTGDGTSSMKKYFQTRYNETRK